MKNKHSKWLAMPFTVWSVIFIIIPLFMIFYYGFVDGEGIFTWDNILAIGEPEHIKALGISIVLSLIATIICLVLAYPLAMILSRLGVNQNSFIVMIFILPMWMNF